MTKVPENSLSISQTARILAIEPDYVYRLVRAGRIAATKRGGKWLVDRTSVEERLVRRAA